MDEYKIEKKTKIILMAMGKFTECNKFYWGSQNNELRYNRYIYYLYILIDIYLDRANTFSTQNANATQN